MNLNEILTNLQQSVVDEADISDDEISHQRERNMRAYYMEPLDSDVDNTEEGEDSSVDENTTNRNDFVTSDVFDTVEDTKAVIVETFASHRNVIRFKPSDENDMQRVELANAYIKKCFWDKNNGYDFIQGAAHDGCIAKNAIAKTYWAEEDESEELSVDGMTLEQVLDLMATTDAVVEPADDFEMAEVEQDTPAGPMVLIMCTGHVTRTTDVSHQKLELVAPESFFAGHDQTSEEFLIAQDRVEMIKDELAEMGVTDDQLAQLTPESAKELLDEETVRHENDSTYDFYEEHMITEGQGKVWLYNGHFWADIDDNGPRAWYIRYCGHLVIGDEDAWDITQDDITVKEAIEKGYIRPLKRMPYRVWSPYPLTHRWSGMALADPVYVIQEMRSKMHRSIIDYMARTNNPRTQGSSENIKNFNEFINNEIGGFIDLEDPAETVEALDQPQMTPLVFNTLEMVTQERDERVPVTRLAAGRNQDAISNQNAEKMIDKLATRGERRVAMVCRNFAEFLRDIFKDIYLIGVENDEKPMMLKVGDEWQQVIPAKMPRNADMEISPALTPEQAFMEAQRMLALHNTMLADEVLAEMYMPMNRYQMMIEVAELMDRQDMGRFITSPESEEYQQAQQVKQQMAQQQQEQMMQMQMVIPQMQAQIAMLQLQLKAKTDTAELSLKEREVNVKEQTATVDAEDKRVDIEAGRLENAASKMGIFDLVAGLDIDGQANQTASQGG